MNGAIATVGMFDGVHRGHRHLLDTLKKQAAERNLRPVVFTFDRHPQQVLRGDDAVAMLTTTEERLRMLRDNGGCEVVVLSFDAAMAQLSAVEFFDNVMSQQTPIRALVLGYDNTFGNKRKDDFAQLRLRLQQECVAVIDDVPVSCDGVEVSSTQIRRALQSGDVPRANAMLGYRYTLSGSVVRGRHIGTTLGVPTVNLDCRKLGKLLPAEGVYAVTASADGRQWIGVANLGSQPTVGGHQPVLEIHLLDDNPMLYDATLSVSFVERLRDIRRFESREALVCQIQQDIVLCRTLF